MERTRQWLYATAHNDFPICCRIRDSWFGLRDCLPFSLILLRYFVQEQEAQKKKMTMTLLLAQRFMSLMRLNFPWRDP